MFRMAWWQWERHQEKIEVIDQMSHRMALPPTDLEFLLANPATKWSELVYRRFTIEGTFDFAEEITVRNRSWEGQPGVHVITPLRFKNSTNSLLVNRGFIPLSKSSQQARKVFRPESAKATLVGLLKPAPRARWFAPKDPPVGADTPRIDQWLRAEPTEVSKQLKTPLIPVIADDVTGFTLKQLNSSMIKSGSDRDEILSLVSRAAVSSPKVGSGENQTFPVQSFDQLLSPGRHLGYVFEWSVMGVFTLLVTAFLQLRRRNYLTGCLTSKSE